MVGPEDWVAVERGYFDEEGLDYELDVVALERAAAGVAGAADPDVRGDIRVGAYEFFGKQAPASGIRAPCLHWAVNQAASDAAGRMWGHAYSVLPSGIYVAARLRHPPARTTLAGVAVAVGYHSGSHFSAIQALEAGARSRRRSSSPLRRHAVRPRRRPARRATVPAAAHLGR